MKESGLWSTLKRNMRNFPGVDICRVENVVVKGMPDVNMCRGGVEAWVELKQENQFPARPTTVVKFNCYSNEQRLWQRARLGAGGRVYVLVQVADEYFLFHASVAAKSLGIQWTAFEMRKMALYHGSRGKVDWGKVLDIICPPPMEPGKCAYNSLAVCGGQTPGGCSVDCPGNKHF